MNEPMKTKIISLIALIFMIIGGCEKQEASNQQEIKHAGTIPGGCNNLIPDDFKSTNENEKDTVFYSMSEDTLRVCAGMNYICCAPFITATDIISDTLMMTISDTCSFPGHSCYCRCDCYYTWDFRFTGVENKPYHYKVKLNSPLKDGETLFREGVIVLPEGLSR